MESAGNGTVVTGFGTSVERLHLNQTNPDAALGELRATKEGGPHPFLTNPVIGQAMSMAIDRQLLVDIGYGAGGQPTCNVLPAPAVYASTANDACLTQDIAGAIALLDENGIVDSDGDGVREYEGTPLVVSYQTSTNAVRQDTQALVKQWWSGRRGDVHQQLRRRGSRSLYGQLVMCRMAFARKPVAGVQHATLLRSGL